jgi:hypothetical protein
MGMPGNNDKGKRQKRERWQHAMPQEIVRPGALPPVRSG